ncbi:MAG TPA: hypothetical protein VL574_13780 [Stellaceae bacterium]|nr:hypothetical protein [Stellaceae bacterium]
MKRSLVAATMMSLALGGHSWGQSGSGGGYGAGGVNGGSGTTGAPTIGGGIPQPAGAIADPAANPMASSPTAAPELPQTNGVMSTGVPTSTLQPLGHGTMTQ